MKHVTNNTRPGVSRKIKHSSVVRRGSSHSMTGLSYGAINGGIEDVKGAVIA
jgi:hypothetical protein